MSADAVWVYAITHDDWAEDRLTGLRGVDSERVHRVVAAGLAAVVGAVSLDEFGEEALRRNLEDLDWVAQKARAHDAVITAVAEIAAVIPVRMATVYLDDDRVRELLADRHAAFEQTLSRLTGRAEVGVKIYADPKQLLAQNAGQQHNGTRTGTAYLMRRRRELASREEVCQAAAAEADRIHATLMRYAVDGKRKPPPDRSLSGRDDLTVLNGTYLVDSDAVALFRETVVALAMSTDRLTMETTGPWPPYSFAGETVTQ
ncbi:gas vesicle protein GvpFL [Mycobacterium sp. ACS1612]|uniref:GvpL/GvpF family gas vesicle protein n=1 Tax=Mycobacterium sp. ACS1612 TaxID=1834117 RepID=UPI0007FCD4C7|nr:GvpL/GvpF family gas vesicle protein [Mycobacterium sp. ACS1612]OBF39625.1 gas vesicle protein GvpFL [Mycobacterium sp. ACS1612]